MPFCRLKFGNPCHRYTGNQAALNQFLTDNGGNEARFDSDGKAHVLTRVKGEDRFVYVLMGSWVRSLGPCQFSVIPSKVFDSEYELVNQ